MRARVILFTAALLVIGHWALRWKTVSLLPLPVTAACVIAFTAHRPWRWLAGVALVGESLTTLPPGFVTAAVLWPWVVQLATPRVEHEPSFRFLGVVALAVVGQLLILSAFDWVAGSVRGAWSLATIWRYTPWPAAALSSLASTTAVFSFVWTMRRG